MAGDSVHAFACAQVPHLRQNSNARASDFACYSFVRASDFSSKSGQGITFASGEKSMHARASCACS